MPELRVEREQIDVTSNAPRRDPDWIYTDHEGHEHRVIGGGWPTLRWVVDDIYWCEDCRDEHAEGHFECVDCGEHISPSMRPAPPYREYIAGPARYFIDDREVTEAEAREFIETANETMVEAELTGPSDWTVRAGEMWPDAGGS